MQRRHEKKNSLYWVYGHHAVLSVLQNSSRQIHKILAAGALYERLVVDYPQTQSASMAEIAAQCGKHAVHQGVAVLTEPKARASVSQLSKQTRIVLCDQITDPHNIGAIARSALGLGFGGMLLQTRHAPSETASLLKAASGAWEHLDIAYVTNISRTLAQLKEQGFWVVGLDGYATDTLETLADLPDKMIVAVGSEENGLRDSTRSACDYRVKLPSNALLESYNASVAAALAMYHLREKCPVL